MRRLEKGFTAVELLVSIIVGALLLGSAYQLYTTVLRDSGSAQRRAAASNAAYDLARQYQQRTTKPCTTLSETPSVPSTVNLPGSTASAVVSCPYGATSSVSLVTVTITYKNPESQQVTRAIATRE